jgi:predicted PurR-regulated permease PerM
MSDAGEPVRAPELEPVQAPPGSDDDFLKRVLTVVGVVTVVILLLLLLYFGIQVVLLVFAASLLAIFLNGVASGLRGWLGLAYGWCLAIVCLLLVAVAALGVWQVGPPLVKQARQLAETLPESLEKLRERLAEHGWMEPLVEDLPLSGEELGEKAGEVAAKAPGVLSDVAGAVGFFVIFLFLGLYLAVDPERYQRGLLRLVPPQNRQHARDVLGDVGYTLHWWLVGTLLSMLVVGTLVTFGLWLLDVPLALALGVIAALAEFIPTIGPVLAFVPAVLLAFTVSGTKVLHVLLLYVVVQTFESYVLYPLVQQRAIELPPALTIVSIALLGILLGGMGLVLATPLVAVVMVLVQRLYVRDVLGDDLRTMGQRND